MMEEGSICTVENGDGKFTVVKILVINDEDIHVRIYKNKYDERLSTIELNTLSLGSVENEDDEFGIGHVALSIEGFDDWKPMVVNFEEVTDNDLEGYYIWLHYVITQRCVYDQQATGLWSASFTPSSLRATTKSVVSEGEV